MRIAHYFGGRTLLKAILAVGLLGGSVWAKPGVVKTRDGSFSGDVSEAEEGKVIVTVGKIPMIISRGDVISIQYVDSPEEQFAKRLADLKPQDARGRLDLATWAMQQRLYKQANQAVEAAISINPNSKEAIDLQTSIRAQQDMDRLKSVAPADGDSASSGDQSAGRRLLTNDDINAIRQKELGREEVPIRFSNDVRKQFCDKEKRPIADFVRLAMSEQARLILDTGTADMRNNVRIMGDPASIVTFKQSIQPVILQGCATQGCHSGKPRGGFVLMSPAQGDQAAYTNFYILTQYTRKVDKAQLAMIDRTQPDRSLLLQYALPRETADAKHPAVQRYNGLFRNANDPRQRLLTDWLTTGLVPQQSDYGIKYDVPGKAASPKEESGKAAPTNGASTKPAPATTPAAGK